MTTTPPPSPPVQPGHDANAAAPAPDAGDAPRVERLRQRLVIGLILMAALYVRVRGLDRHNLWFDEAVTVWIASKPVGELFALVKHWERTPPLHYLIVRAISVMAGDSEAAVRMPSVAAGVGAVWLTFLIGRYLFDWRGGAAAALLLALSPYQVFYSQEARAYALMEFLALASCYLFLRSLDSAGWRTRSAYVALSALMLYAHLYSAFALVAQNLFYAGLLLARRPPRLRPLHWIGLQAGVLALFAPWLPTTWWWTRSVAGTFWVERFTWDEITRTWWAYVGSGPALLAIACLAVIAAFRAGTRRGWAFCVLLGATPVVLPVAISVLKSPMFTHRYGIAAAPGLCLLAGAGLVALRWRALQVVALLCVALPPLLRIDPPPENLPPDPPWPDWRSAGAFLRQSLRRGDYVAINMGGNVLLYERYVGRTDVEVSGFANATVPFPSIRRRGSRAWLILYTPSHPPRDILASGNWRVVTARRFSDIHVWQVEQASSTAPATQTD